MLPVATGSGLVMKGYATVSDVSPIGQLIEDVRNAFLDRHGVGLSYDAIAKRGGNVIKGARVHQIAHEPIRALPPFDTLRALAKGLEVPYSVVLEKALISAGYEVPSIGARSDERDRRIG